MGVPPPESVRPPTPERPGGSPSAVRILSGGVVAYNEERNIERALESLLSQELPEGWQWGTVWVVASGCTDRTVPIARRVAARDARVQVIVESERRGKARALGEILRHATGDALVLLNSDARATPRAISELLRTAEGKRAPFAVMGRPLPTRRGPGPVGRMVRLLWDIHDEFHREVLARGQGTHLSDELLLLSLPMAPQIPDGIINDGSYVGAWLTQHEGGKLYAPTAVVETESPTSLRDHLTQRRRILVGHRQVTRMMGVAPSALPGYALAHPGAAIGVVQRALRQGQHPLRDLFFLMLGEVAATFLAGWDRVPPQRDHVRWRRISDTGSAVERPPSDRAGESWANVTLAYAPNAGEPTSFTDLRVETLLRVARKFGTGIPLDELSALLPVDGPAEVPDLREWLVTRPDLAHVAGDRVFAPNGSSEAWLERESRALEYRRAAEQLVHRHLRPMLPWVRCVGITGSAAYGAPEANDDLDLFVVTRTGSLWLFLAYTYVAVRLRANHDPRSPPPCFNYVLEDRQAQQEFAEARGFLFAREALMTRICHGESYYQDLLAGAPWLAGEIPRLYARRSSGVPPRTEPPAPWAIRLVNACLFPPLATYLQLAGLWRNARLRDQRTHRGQFRTQTGPRRLAFVSDRFDRLRADLAPASLEDRAELRMGGPSRTSGAR
jgi:hypothetical protein